VRVLIAGCGYVGTELGLRLARAGQPARPGSPEHAGHEIWGLRRNASGLPRPIRPLSADLRDPELASHLPRVDRVVYTVAADTGSEDAYRAAYVDGVDNLIAALREAGAPVDRFVFASSTAVYGGRGGEWVDEATPPAPVDFRGSAVLEGERRTHAGPFPAVVLRLGGIYGPGRGRLIERVRGGEARCSPGEPNWSNRIHRDDAAGALAHLVELDHPAPIYVGVDDEPSPVCDVYRFVAALLGVRSPPDGADDRAPASNKRCSNARLKRDGYRFEFPTYREGYRALIRGSP
jgi:nucleoside-diphosphate-sugar epimerase